MATRFVERAVASLHAYIEANYPTYLRAVETELGLSSGALPDPKDYVPADLPFDNRNPRVDIYEDDWDLEDDHVDIMANVGCSIAWSYSSDADTEAGELLARRCLTAMIKCIWADRTLGGTVVACLLEGGSAGSLTEEKITRHLFHQPVTVRLHEVM